jgi:hypothetical protein
MTVLGRRRLRRAGSLAAILALVATLLVATTGHRAFADATAPPANSPSPAQCPRPEYPQPPPGADNPAPGDVGPTYEVPFKGAIMDGELTIPPNIVVPHIFASQCGVINLPSLKATILPFDVVFPANSPNTYVAGLEALPISVGFTKPLTSGALSQASNGGLNVAITTSNEASTCNPSSPPSACPATSLGMSCSVVVNNITFTTQTSGKLTGQPVTGPTSAGTAVVVSNDFSIPAVQSSPTCPPAVAQVFNKLLGLPLPPGVATFTAPFTFTFELDCPDVSNIKLPYTCPTGPPIS